MTVNSPVPNLSADHRGWAAEDWSNEFSLGLMAAKRLRFIEADLGAAGDYVGIVNLPKGATLYDIVVAGVSLWDDATSAVLKVGRFTAAGVAEDDDGYYTAVDLKATDLLADETLRLSGNLATAGGQGGAFTNVGTNTHLTDLHFPSGGQIRATLTTGAGAGTAGETTVDVLYYVPNERQVV